MRSDSARLENLLRQIPLGIADQELDEVVQHLESFDNRIALEDLVLQTAKERLSTLAARGCVSCV